MKKISFLINLAIFICIGISNAQYKDMLDFNGTSNPQGAYAYGSFIRSGKTLYGMTSNGGVYGFGNIFKLDTNGSNYANILDFDGPVHGITPYGNLVLSGKTLYGVAFNWGPNDSGLVFSVDTNGAGFKDMHNFTYPTGSGGYGTLLLLGKVLYGVASYGGAHDSGCLYSIDTNGLNYKDIFDFDGANGSFPAGSLVISGKKLLGITVAGGANHYGCIYSVDTNGTNYTDLFDYTSFNPQTNCSVNLIGNKIFSETYYGGVKDSGYIFSIDTGGGGYKDIFDFDGTNGAYPLCPLTSSGKTLYGVTYGGGTHDFGTVFSVDTDGSSFTNMINFNNMSTPQGAYPTPDLLLSGSYLYGMTYSGGAYNSGVVYKVDTNSKVLTTINNLSSNQNNIIAYPNPSDGKFVVQWSVASGQQPEKAQIEIYNMLGEKVYDGQFTMHNGQCKIDLSGQPAGIYMLRITNAKGTLLKEDKLVILH